MEVNVQKTKVMSFTCKMNSIHISDVLNLRPVCIKCLRIALRNTLYFNCRVKFVYFQTKSIGVFLVIIHIISLGLIFYTGVQ